MYLKLFRGVPGALREWRSHAHHHPLDDHHHIPMIYIHNVSYLQNIEALSSHFQSPLCFEHFPHNSSSEGGVSSITIKNQNHWDHWNVDRNPLG